MKIIKYDSLLRRDTERVLDFLPYSEKAEISLILDTFPSNGFMAYSLGSPSGIACSDIADGKKRATFHIFVVPSARRRGAGTALFERVFKQAEERGVKTLVCGIDGSDSALFAQSLGMKKKYSSDYMTFRGDTPKNAAEFEKYNDGMFEEFVEAEGAAFLPVRLRTGAEPSMLQPTANVRAFLSRAAESYFVLRKDGRIVAGAGCHGGEISDVFVSEEYRGKGIGRMLVERCIVHSRNNGIDNVFLNVVSDNVPAVKLYKSIGFATEKTTDFYVKQTGN